MHLYASRCAKRWNYTVSPLRPATTVPGPRAVEPPAEQVRLPIYRHGIGQWRRFEPWLGPLKMALGKVGMLSTRAGILRSTIGTERPWRHFDRELNGATAIAVLVSLR